MTIAHDPAISVVMAAYNGAGLIRQTIASVVTQTFTDFELIVVDDASTDDTLTVLHAIDDPRLIVIAAAANGGPVAARNRAFAAARGRYIVGLDQDDLCHRDRFAIQFAFLEDNPGTVLVASAFDLLENGVITPARPPLVTTPVLIDWRLQFGNPLAWSSVMFRADAARRLPVFERKEHLFAEDFDLYHRLARQGAIARIDDTLLTYRLYPGGASQRYKQGMNASAAAVLADVYGPLLGSEADPAAWLVQTHFNNGEPVPDQTTLHRLNAYLGKVHDSFVSSRRPGPADLALIVDEYARLWWRMADATVRSGALSLDAVAAACPLGWHPRHPSARRVAGSAMIGALRALLARIASAAPSA